MQANQVLLSDVPRFFVAKYGKSPSYSAVHKAVLNGHVPAHKEGKQWIVDVDATAAHFGLTQQQPI